MELALARVRYAHALGRHQAAWRFAGPELRRTVALAQISAAWDTFRRDAGRGAVGPAHEISPTAGLLTSDDPRRDAMLLWLADHAAPAFADAAALLGRAAGASRRFDKDEQALLVVAQDALADDLSLSRPITRLVLAGGTADEPALGGLLELAAAIDRLRADPAFLERAGEETRHVLPGGAFSHFVPAAPGAAWALNLALLARAAPLSGAPPGSGLISRALFRDLEAEEIAVTLVEGATSALEAGYVMFGRIASELERGREALGHMSRNSRTRDAWPILAALGSIARAQLGRALCLSRAGADIQAHALANAGLAALETGGRVAWARYRSAKATPAPATDDAERAGVFADFDASMAEIDRLLD